MKAILAACAFAVLATSASAQPAGSRFSIAAGAGMAKQTYGELDFDSSPAWDVSVRFRTSPHFAVEALFDQWRKVQHDVHFDQDSRMSTLGINALATGEWDRVTVAAGGGAGLMVYTRRYSQSGFSNTFSSSSLTAQGTADLDVAVTRRLAVFARYDLIVPVQEPGFLHGTIAAGVRVGIR